MRRPFDPETLLTFSPVLLANSQQIDAPGPIEGLGGYLVAAIVLIFIFRKAGEASWAGFVPLYNLYVYTRVAGYNPWLFLLLFVPLVNIVFLLLITLRLARAFGHGGVFGFFLVFFPPLSIVGHLIMGLGSDTYDRRRIPA